MKLFSCFWAIYSCAGLPKARGCQQYMYCINPLKPQNSSALLPTGSSRNHHRQLQRWIALHPPEFSPKKSVNDAAKSAIIFAPITILAFTTPRYSRILMPSSKGVVVTKNLFMIVWIKVDIAKVHILKETIANKGRKKLSSASIDGHKADHRYSRKKYSYHP